MTILSGKTPNVRSFAFGDEQFSSHEAERKSTAAKFYELWMTLYLDQKTASLSADARARRFNMHSIILPTIVLPYDGLIDSLLIYGIDFHPLYLYTSGSRAELALAVTAAGIHRRRYRADH